MAASRQPVTSTGPCHPRPPRLLVSPATSTGPHVYLTASKIWYRLKRFLGTIYYENGAWLRPAWRFFCGTPADAERVVCFAPRRRWCLWRFAALIPSGCRLTPIHKVMGDHASRDTTTAEALYRLKRFSGTNCHNIHVWFHLKRFLGTVCYEHGAW